MRCVERRLALSRLPASDYIERLHQQPLEFNNLFNHITIKVSEFFRDPEVFKRIEGEVLPLTLERLRSQDRNLLRIWSCGCARGEEAYSMAILFLRLMEGPALPSHDKFALKIFATDIDEAAIDLARKGHYLKESLMNVSPLIRSQFFTSSNAGDTVYQVTPLLRNLVTFGVHNMVSYLHLSHMVSI